MTSVVPQQETGTADEGNFRYLEPEEARALFDQSARSLMQMSGEEFLRRLDAGEFDEALAEDDNRDLSYLSMIATLGR